MNKYNALIIGCGAQGVGVGQEKNPDKIINFAHAIKKHPGFNNIVFYDKDDEKSSNAAAIWNSQWLEDDLSYFRNEYADIAIITTPDNEHYEILKQLVEYPLKLVICEKPICEDLQQAREIVETYKAKGIPLMVNYTRRFLPYYDHLKKYGKPLYACCEFNRGWIHTASHAIDFFNMIGCSNYEINEIIHDSRIWNINVFYSQNRFIEERWGDEPVWDYYDKSHMHIINNVYEFLEGREEIKCTGEMALRSLEICFNLMENNMIDKELKICEEKWQKRYGIERPVEKEEFRIKKELLLQIKEYIEISEESSDLYDNDMPEIYNEVCKLLEE